MLIVENVGVYHNEGGVSEYHFNSLKSIRFDGHRHYYGASDLEYLLATNYQMRFAGFHVPFPANDKWLIELHQVYNHVDHVFVFCSELHESTVKQLKQVDRPKVTIFACGFFLHSFAHAKVHVWMDWLVQTLWFYKEKFPDFLTKRLTTGNENFYFDILLGCQRTHRDFVFNWLKNYNRLQDNYVKYVQHINQDLKSNPDFYIETEGVEFISDSKLTHSIDQVMYFGERMSLSVIVPYTIYNQCHYSLVTETNFYNEFNFYTEKIAKPILAGRLFIVIAGKDYLKNLRSLGFKTFDGIIDESYDQIEDHKTRWDRAMLQLDWLCFQNPEHIKQLAKPIVEHNQQVLMNTNWYQDFSDKFADDLIFYLKHLNLRQV